MAPRRANDRPARSGGAGYWPAWVTLGLAAAASGTALALTLVGQKRAEEADDLSLPHSQARPLRDSAESLALSGYILFGVAGAAAVASGVLFYLGYRWATADAPLATIAPLPGGAAVFVSPLRW